MKRRMQEKETTQAEITKLVNQMDTSEICLPSFQRDFVWTKEQMALLIESVIRHYPIGCFMYLNCDMNQDFGYFSFAETDKKAIASEYYVIDGQQRLRTFFKLLHEAKKYEAFDPIECQGGNYKFYYDVRYNPYSLPKEIRKPTFIVPISTEEEEKDEHLRKEVKYRIPVEFLMSEKNSEKWIKLSIPKKSKSRKKEFESNIEETRSLICSYKCPIEKINMRLNPKDHANMFQLLNEGGTDLTIFDLLVAEFTPEKVNLRKLWKQALKDYANLAKYNIDPLYVIRTLVLIRKTKNEDENPTCKKPDIRKLRALYDDVKNVSKALQEDWGEAVRFVDKAMDKIVNNFGVCKRKYLPYSPMIITLAIAEWWVWREEYPEVSKRKINQKIRRWYWSSVFDNKYEKSTDNVISKEYSALRKWLAPRGSKKMPSDISVYFSKYEIEKKILNDIESAGDARYKAIMCMPLIDGKGRDIYSENILDKKAVVNDHHIYPKASDVTKGCDKNEVNNIVNRMLITGETNNEIWKKSPYDYLESVPNRILAKHFLFKSIVSKQLSFGEFMEKRKKLLVNAIYNLLTFGDID